MYNLFLSPCGIWNSLFLGSVVDSISWYGKIFSEIDDGRLVIICNKSSALQYLELVPHATNAHIRLRVIANFNTFSIMDIISNFICQIVQTVAIWCITIIKSLN